MSATANIICKKTNKIVSPIEVDEAFCREFLKKEPHPDKYGGGSFDWYSNLFSYIVFTDKKFDSAEYLAYLIDIIFYEVWDGYKHVIIQTVLTQGQTKDLASLHKVFSWFSSRYTSSCYRLG